MSGTITFFLRAKMSSISSRKKPATQAKPSAALFSSAASHQASAVKANTKKNIAKKKQADTDGRTGGSIGSHFGGAGFSQVCKGLGVICRVFFQLPDFGLQIFHMAKYNEKKRQAF